MHADSRPIVIVLAPTHLVVANRTEMKTFLLAQLALGTDVILDLRNTLHLDSSALGMLLSVEKAFRLVGCTFALCGARQGIPHLLEITQVNRRILVARTVDEAIPACARATTGTGEDERARGLEVVIRG